MTDVQPDNKLKDEEPDDPVESMLKKTGCIELHYKVQVCETKQIMILVIEEF